MTEPIITKELAIFYLRDKIWLVSHGGVASQKLAEVLCIKYSQSKIFKRLIDKSVKNRVAHFPYPLPKGPNKAIYLYGDLFNSIISQVGRHPANAAKLHNDKNYPRFYKLADLFQKGNKNDPFGIANQFYNFCSLRADYPIMLVNYYYLEKSIKEICRFIGADPKNITWEHKPRKSIFEELPLPTQQQLEHTYGTTKRRMDDMPPVVIIPPFREEKMTKIAPTTHETVLVKSWEYLLKDSQQIIPENSSFEDVKITRVKMPSMIFSREQGDWLFLNARACLPTGTCDTSYIVAWKLERQSLSPIQKGELLEIKSPCDPSILKTGPEDQRVIQVQSDIIIVFSMLDENAQRRMHIYNFTKRQIIKLKVNEFELQKTEKNWSPLVIDDELHFVYRLNPLRILKCTDLETGICEIVHDEDTSQEGVGNSLHGGTEFKLWRWPLYVGFAHSHDPWRPQLVVLDVESFKVVHAGSTFNVPQPKEVKPWRGKSVQYPASINFTPSQILLGIEYEDKHPALVSLPLEVIERGISFSTRFEQKFTSGYEGSKWYQKPLYFSHKITRKTENRFRSYYINQKQKGRGLIYATVLIPWQATKRFYESQIVDNKNNIKSKQKKDK
jgi:hypothetical protein